MLCFGVMTVVLVLVDSICHFS